MLGISDNNERERVREYGESANGKIIPFSDARQCQELGTDKEVQAGGLGGGHPEIKEQPHPGGRISSKRLEEGQQAARTQKQAQGWAGKSYMMS